MLDSLFIVDSNGCVVIEKHWRQLVPRRIVDELVVAVTSEVAAAAAAAAASAAQTAAAAAGETNGAGSSAEALSSGSLASVLPADAPAAAAASLAGRPADGVLPPITSIEQYKMLYISRFGLLFVAAVSTEASPASIFFFLHQIVELFTDYFVGISEVTLKENFVIVYELLEELVDYGSPYITEPCLLKDMIPPPSLLSTMINAVSIGTQFSSKQPTGTVSTVPWRPTGLKYTNNEIFFDIIEELDVIVDKRGKVVAGTIFGEIICNSKLSGMPDLLLSLGNKNVIGEGMASLHPSVRVGRFDRDRVLSFIPPDGMFRLMEYNVPLTSENQLPLSIKPNISLRKGRAKIDLTINPRVSSEKQIDGIVVSARMPTGVTSVRMNANVGQCSFDQITKTLRWTVGKLAGDLASTGVPIFTGQLVTDHATDLSTSRKSITFNVEFRINTYSASGLRIDSLAVQNEAYTPFKGGRGYTKASRFQIRCL